MTKFKLTLSLIFLSIASYGQENERARELGIVFTGTPGQLNAITDVKGVTVGYKTLTKDLPNNKAVRTGVTVILPRGRETMDHSVFGGWFSLNGNGEMTGTTWVEELSLIHI